MAINNRDRIGKAMDLLAEGLLPYVDHHMAAASTGKDWVELLAARLNQRNGSNFTVDKTDLQVQLRCITEEWRAFPGLGRVEQNYASELREARNAWAHNKQFDGDDTLRTLDTAFRLLTAVGAVDQAAEAGRMRADLQRNIFDSQARNKVRTATASVSTPGQGIKPWREIIEPHDDVAQGNFHSAEFAADLHVVAVGESTKDEYADPTQFFARTYVTEGLSDLLGRAARRLTGDSNASPVVNLQTNFGGGKTHSMLALWHLFSGLKNAQLPQAVQDAIGSVEVGDASVRRVALVGTALGPNQPRIKADGTAVRTLWGELAWQLGGREAYDVIADSDRTSTPPGDALTGLIAKYSPALIMIDEWVAYARNLNDDDSLCGGRFEAQFTFAQQLTEAVSATPGAMLVISIPASDGMESADAAQQIEIGGSRGREALAALQNVVGRTADHWRPANSLESFEIVKRRLFKEPGAQARTEIDAVSKQFVAYYQENSGTFPREASDFAYTDRLRAAYPIHPELFDRLYNDWSTLERFQRTRGVLRLMSSVIHELWVSGDASPLIMPGSVPLHTASVSGELTNYLPDSWKPIIDQDIDGEAATPVRIDTEKQAFGSRSLTRRIARAVFMGSAPTLRSDHRGIEKPRIWLGVAIPGDTIGNFGSALEVLGQRATYFYADSGRFWFDTNPSISRAVADIADKLREHPETVWEELRARMQILAQDKGLFSAVHTAPGSTGDIPDTDSARLVLLHPRQQHQKGKTDSSALEFARDAMKHHGTSNRSHSNMLVFAALDEGRFADDLEPAVRQYLAWKRVADRADEMDLKSSDKARAIAQAKTEDSTVGNRLRDALRWMLVPTQDPPGEPAFVSVETVNSTTGSVAAEFSSKLRTSDRLTAQYSPARVRLALNGPLATIWDKGHVSVGALWSLYTQYPYCDRLSNRHVFDDAMRSVLDGLAFEQDGFALAEAYDEDGDRYIGLRIPGPATTVGAITDSWLVVKPEVALLHQAHAAAAAAAATPGAGVPQVGPSDGGGAVPTPALPGGSGGTAAPSQAGPAPKTRYFGAIDLDPKRYSSQLASIMQEVLQRLEAQDGTVVSVALEIIAKNPAGFTEQVVRSVSENSSTLKFGEHGFEEF